MNITNRVLIIAVCIALVFSAMAEGTYRKPPFNGSIFGKRNAIEYDSSGRALMAMCELAVEACQSFIMPQDTK